MKRILPISAIVAGAACAPGGSPPDTLVGGWQIVETTTTTADSTWVHSDPEPGLYLFTESHFSNMLIQGGPRDALPPDPSPGQRLAAYDPFIADAGSYIRTDSLLVTSNRIAKVPNVMDSGVTYRYALVGDTLRLTFTGGWAPSDGEITYLLTRLRER